MQWLSQSSNLPPKKTDLSDLARLNLRVSKIARSRGSSAKEHELLLKGLECLEALGAKWKEYDVTLELYIAVILSEFSLGRCFTCSLIRRMVMCSIATSHQSLYYDSNRLLRILSSSHR